MPSFEGAAGAGRAALWLVARPLAPAICKQDVSASAAGLGAKASGSGATAAVAVATAAAALAFLARQRGPAAGPCDTSRDMPRAQLRAQCVERAPPQLLRAT